MLKRLRKVKTSLGSMVILEFWSFWREVDQIASEKVKDTILDDGWWERVDLTIKIMDLIISFLRFADIDQPILRDVYEGLDSMIGSVKTIVIENECPKYETSTKTLSSTIHDILIARWDKNCTPLHFLAHSLNPRFYSHEWLNGGPSCRFPYMDREISQGRKVAFRRIYHDSISLQEVEKGFIKFSNRTERFGGYDVLGDRGVKRPHGCRETHGESYSILQQLAMRVPCQVTVRHNGSLLLIAMRILSSFILSYTKLLIKHVIHHNNSHQ